MYQKFVSLNGPVLRYGSFVQLKPCYFFPPTAREKESCLCVTCLNIHVLYECVRFNIKDKSFPSSLSEYITSTIVCEHDENLQFPKLDCLSGTCANECKINTSNAIQVNGSLVSYYQFESVVTNVYSKTGQKKEYPRTARIDKKATINDIFDLLIESMKKYICHRYFVINNKFFWTKFCCLYAHPILTIDYSENIQFKPKFEARSAHFSGKQQTLHCCVFEKSGDMKFLYHLSDDKHRDSVMLCIQDIIENYPSVIASGNLVLRSDNCSTQYKS